MPIRHRGLPLLLLGAVPFAAVIKIALDEYTRPRREAMAALLALGGAGAGAS